MADGVPAIQVSLPKKWWRSKTMLFNALMGAMLAAEASLHLLQPLLPIDVYLVASFVLVVGNKALRAITKSGVAL